MEPCKTKQKYILSFPWRRARSASMNSAQEQHIYKSVAPRDKWSPISCHNKVGLYIFLLHHCAPNADFIQGWISVKMTGLTPGSSPSFCCTSARFFLCKFMHRESRTNSRTVLLNVLSLFSPRDPRQILQGKFVHPDKEVCYPLLKRTLQSSWFNDRSHYALGWK